MSSAAVVISTLMDKLACKRQANRKDSEKIARMRKLAPDFRCARMTLRTFIFCVSGGIHFLKGFQITLYGISFRSFDKTLCAVINLNGTNEATISRLMNVRLPF